MNDLQTPEHVEQIVIGEINVLNPRTRNKRIHKELVENIRAIGLKRPITVSRRQSSDGPYRYDLICGQGRMEAFMVLGQRVIPAFVTDASSEDCLVMSLVENVARRNHRPIDLMREVGRLRERGSTDHEIAEKIGVTVDWAHLVVKLLEKGEDKLLAAVETGALPLSMAIEISRSNQPEVQDLLTNAYEQGFRGKKLATLRRLIESRDRRTQQIQNSPIGLVRSRKKKLTPTELRRLFQDEVEKQRLIAKKAAFTHDCLVFATQALKELLATPDFSVLLAAESLDSVPKLLKTRIQATGVSA